MDLDSPLGSGCLKIQQIDPAEVSPGQFNAMVLREVEERGVRLVVIDSLNGYLSSMPQEQHLVLQLHELLSYLNQKGATTLLIMPQHGMVGNMSSPVDVSFIADTVILIRFFEAEGRIRKAVSVLKNRAGPHEDAIREFRIDRQGVRVGEPLVEFRGIMTGTPEYVGPRDPLMEDRGRAG